MYLDTDIILALIKKDDWLKKYIKLSFIEKPKTSVLTIIESRIVLEREYSKEESLRVLARINELKIQIIPLGEKTIAKSIELTKKYPKLGIFDSIHAACSIIVKDKIISTDSIYSEINEVNHIDPRKQFNE